MTHQAFPSSLCCKKGKAQFLRVSKRTAWAQVTKSKCSSPFLNSYTRHSSCHKGGSQPPARNNQTQSPTCLLARFTFRSHQTRSKWRICNKYLPCSGDMVSSTVPRNNTPPSGLLPSFLLYLPNSALQDTLLHKSIPDFSVSLFII